MALNSPKVGECPEDNLKEVLRYIMVVLGIRANNIPSGIEKVVLINFIRTNYAAHTLQELRLAFEMAVCGKLEIGPDGAKCFENFSCEYFGRIMQAYRKWASVEYSHISKPEPLLLEAPIKADWSEAWNDVIEYTRNGQIESKIIVTPIFDWLIENKILQMDQPKYESLYRRASKMYLHELKTKIASGSFTREDKINLNRMNGDDYEEFDEIVIRINNKAKIIAIKELAAETVKNEGK